MGFYKAGSVPTDSDKNPFGATEKYKERINFTTSHISHLSWKEQLSHLQSADSGSLALSSVPSNLIGKINFCHFANGRFLPEQKENH